ncbi:MAG TPA: DUF6177 family protein [Rugosimonospora sp.]
MAWPVVDILTDRTAVLLQDRPVVGLSQGLVDAFIAAADGELDIQVVTPSTSRLTMPLRMALLGERRWVVHVPGRGYVDGAGGGLLRWEGGAFVPAGTDGTTGAIDATGTSVGAGSTGGAGTGRQLWLNIELRHERPPVAFGLGVQAACRALTGEPPAGWGPAEPVSQPWHPDELSRTASGRAPRPTLVSFVGGGGRPAIGTLEIAATPSGPAESATLVVGYRATEEPPLAALPALAETLAGEHGLALFFAVLRPGREDLTFPPALTGPTPAAGPIPGGRATPVGLAVGPAARGDVGATEALTLHGARPIGPRHRGTAWYDLPDGWASVATVASVLHADVPLPVP